MERVTKPSIMRHGGDGLRYVFLEEACDWCTAWRPLRAIGVDSRIGVAPPGWRHRELPCVPR
ncbi:hypothetical protein E2C01_040179 [Portunus trituberculatus]|uniref:Uncharacterized protein n=1 Tax=Portunus trituberculatus TaxID=210409 RepID=A0A5B7FMM1_PORTR|nr:hypothetical protein [Portunus trituberculatus]